jgi:hypothetical protein
MMRNMRIQSAAAANLSCGDHPNFESTLRIHTPPKPFSAYC